MKKILVKILIVMLIFNSTLVPNAVSFAAEDIKKGIQKSFMVIDGKKYAALKFQIKYNETASPKKAFRNKGYFITLFSDFNGKSEPYTGFIKTNSSANNGVITVEYLVSDILEAIDAPIEAYFSEGDMMLDAGMVLIEDGVQLVSENKDKNFEVFDNDRIENYNKTDDYQYLSSHLYRTENDILKAPNDRWQVSWSGATQKNFKYSFEQPLHLEKTIDIAPHLNIQLNDTSNQYIMSEKEMYVDVEYTLISDIEIGKAIPFTKYFITSNNKSTQYPGNLNNVPDGVILSKVYTKRFLRNSLKEGINNEVVSGSSTVGINLLGNEKELHSTASSSIVIDVKPAVAPELILKGTPVPDRIKYEGSSLSTDITVDAEALDSKIVTKWLLKCGDQEDNVIKVTPKYSHTFTVEIPKSEIEANLTGSEWTMKVPIYAKATDGNDNVSEAHGEVDVIIYKDVPPPKPNRRPDIRISMPSYAIEGENFNVEVAGSDPEGEAITFSINTPSVFSKDLKGGNNTVYADNFGRVTVSGYTTDASGNKSKVASKEIDIYEALPFAIFENKGNLRTNYKQAFDGSKSRANSSRYPIISYLWSVKPISGMTDTDIHIQGNNVNGLKMNAQFDKPGVVEVSLTVTNSKGKKHTATHQYTIGNDLGLTPNLYSPPIVYRDKNNDKNATIVMIDKTVSQDMDLIDLRFFFITKNTDNDKNMNEEMVWIYDENRGWVNTNKTYGEFRSNPYLEIDLLNDYVGTDEISVDFETDEVGNYRCDVVSFEGYYQRIPEFTTLEKIAKSNTFGLDNIENKTTVDNIAPITSLSISTKDKEAVDIVVWSDYSGANKINMQIHLQTLRANLFAKGKDANIIYADEVDKIGEQHGTKDYYLYERRINYNYRISGRGETSVSGQGNTVTNYNNDYRSSYSNYETKWAYSTPSVNEFEKSKDIEIYLSSFSKSSDRGRSNGKRIVAYDQSNPGTTRINIDISEYSEYQGMNFCYINNYSVSDVKWSGGSNWTQSSSKQVHDYQYDMPSLKLPNLDTVGLREGSRRIFLTFAEGTNTSYRYDNPMDLANYKFHNLTKEFISEVVKNDFETYVVANPSVLDVKFDDSNKYDSDVQAQTASLRNLAKCSAIRGKILQDWEHDLNFLYESNLVKIDDVKVKNNIVEIKLAESVGEFSEVSIDVIRELLDTTDGLGNTSDIIEKLSVENITGQDGLKDLDGGLAFTESSPIYDKEEIVSERTFGNFMSTLKRDGTVTTYNTNGYNQANYIDTSTWTDIVQIEGNESYLVGLKSDGNIVYSGRDDSSNSYNRYMEFDEKDMYLSNVKEIISVDNGTFLYHTDNSLTLFTMYMYYRDGRRIRHVSRSTLKQKRIEGLRYFNVTGTKDGVIALSKRPDFDFQFFGTIANMYSLGYSEARAYNPIEMHMGSSNIYFKTSNSLWYRCFNRNTDGWQSARHPRRISEFNSSTEFIMETTKELVGYDPINKTFVVKDLTENRSSLSTDLRNTSDVKKVLEISDIGVAYMTESNQTKFAGSISNLNEGYYYQLKRNSEKELLDDALMENGVLIPRLKVLKNIKGLTGDIKDIITVGYDCHVVLYKSGRTRFIRNNDPSVKYQVDNNVAKKYQSANNYSDIKQIEMMGGVVYMLRNNGSFVLLGDNVEGDYNTYETAQGLRDVKTFSIGGGNMLIIIKNDGSFQRFGYYHQSYFDDSNAMSSLYADNDFEDVYSGSGIIVKKKDGTLLSTMQSTNVAGASDVKDIFFLNSSGVYLKNDGTVSYVNSSPRGLNALFNLKDVKQIKHSGNFVFALTEDNTLYQFFVGGSYTLPKRIPMNPIDNEAINYRPQMTQVHLGDHSEKGIAFKYKLFLKEEDSVYIPVKNERLNDTWKVIANDGVITCNDTVYIGVAEVNAENEVLQYSYSQSHASKNK